MNLKIFFATNEDIELLTKHRLEMWQDILNSNEEMATVDRNEERTHNWIKEKFASGKLIGLIAKTEDGKVAGSGCIWLREEQPRPMSTLVEAPYLLSIYTEKRFRKKGVAKLIVQTAIAWSRENGYDRISLHTSDEGKPLYEAFGFQPGREMRLML